MSTLWHIFIDPLAEQAFQKALIGGILVSIVCGVIGCFVILRRMAFLGDAISHAMLAGVTAGYLFMQIVFNRDADTAAMLIGSILAGIITVALIAFVSRMSRIKEDTAIGIMYTGIFAVGGVLASIFSDRIHIDLYHFVTGMVLGVSDSDLWMMAIVASIVLTVVILFFRHFKITTFDPVMAASIGVPVVAMDYLLTTCTSLVVVSAVNIVGVILVVGLLVTPAATAYLLCDRLSKMMILAAISGTISVAGGLYISNWIGNVATGPSIVIFSTLQFLLVMVIAPKYGMIADWWRRKSTVPQTVVEDILGCFRYASSNSTTIQAIQKSLKKGADQIKKAIRSLEKQELLTIRGNELTLTDSGQEKAQQLLRAHRLWETYLQRVGIPDEELHKTAHILEHINDEETVDYLDDKLGHPLTDPHGAEIPEDLHRLVPGTSVKASLLRAGHSAEVIALGEEVQDLGLTIGQILRAGQRQAGGAVWKFEFDDGRSIDLNHDQADDVTVQLRKGTED